MRQIIRSLSGMMLLFLLTLVFSLALSVQTTTYAQTNEEEQTLNPDLSGKGTLPRLSIEEPETGDDPADILVVISELPYEIQEELMAEGDRAFSYCQKNYTMSRNIDCSCYAFKHIGARFEKGPDLDFYNLVNQVEMTPCVFAPAVAGTNYERCLRVMHSKDYTPDIMNQLCRCVSDKMVTSQQNNPTLNVSIINNLFSNNLNSCIRQVVNPY